jgi:hypothetical protein
MLRERDHPAPPAALDLDWQLFAACSELEVEESDRLFFCGQGQSRLAEHARAICAGWEVQSKCLAFALRHPQSRVTPAYRCTPPFHTCVTQKQQSPRATMPLQDEGLDTFPFSWIGG